MRSDCLIVEQPGDCADFQRHRRIALGQAAGVKGGEDDLDPVIDIGPFGVMSDVLGERATPLLDANASNP